MNNIKKLGLTALAGSLVASTAYAGTLEVTGSASVKYQSRSGSSGSTAVQGNPWSDGNVITFSGSGDLENGMTLGYSYTMDNLVFSTSSVTLDMGDAGMVAFGDGTAFGGIDTIKDRMPTAGEEVWDDIDAPADAAGVTDVGSDPSLYYKGTFSGITASASYARTGLGTDTSVALVAADLVEGAEFGIGTATNALTHLTEDDMITAYARYSTGPVTVGVQLSEIDKTAANSDVDREAAAISFAVNENLSISYGISTVKYESSSLVDAESTGISASYTMGGIKIGAVANKTDSFGGAAGTDKEFTEVSLAFAFN